MFDTIKEAQDQVAALSDEELAELTVLTLTEHLAGNITDSQAEFVSTLILADLVRRIEQADAMFEKELGATVN